MSAEVSEEDVLAVLNAVDRGEVTTREEDRKAFASGFCGVFWFELSNGWRVAIFNDCHSWDYVEAVIPPNGDPIDLWPFDEQDRDGERWFKYVLVRNWGPSSEEASVRAWGM